MIVNYDQPGQLCNRIWSLLPSIAYGLEMKEKVLIINFDEYLDIFADLNSTKYVRFKSRKLAGRFFRSLKSRGYVQNGKTNIFRKLFNLNLVEGWSNRLGNAEMVEKQSEPIRQIFSFDENITQSVYLQLSDNKEFIIIGVHIRRGDYKEWLNGLYYYTDNEYFCTLKDVKNKFEAEGKKVKFLICSNEDINLANFPGLDCFTISDSSGAKDLYALSKCDYIIGPPSSYSQWASFYGKVPVKYMMTKDEKINISDFSEIVSFNRFKNNVILNID